MVTNPYQSPQKISLPERRASSRRFSFIEIFIVGHIASFFLLLLAPSAAASFSGEISAGGYMLSGAVALFTRLPWLVVVCSLWGGAATACGFFLALRSVHLLARFISK